MISLAYLFLPGTPWYLETCPLNATEPSYRDRLKTGLDPNLRVPGMGAPDIDLVIWHAMTANCGNSISDFLAAKREFGGTLKPQDIKIAAELYEAGEIDLSSFDLALQIAATSATESK
ncbi:hypothetical protein LCL97_01685 [Seohaeicola saemankumensis]|nr:hypothetical protein [Seohaeicola saemankumensis]MCA0869525.1 hypothetical protein [Seohaeicola saemankumensis]